MKTMHAYLRLSTNLTDHTRDRCPDIVFFVGEDEVAAIRTDAEHPKLPMPDESLHKLVLNDDALSRAIDEEAWLLEFARVLAPGGELRFTVPATGPLTWLDTMNAYRYIVDITRRGHSPDAALPTGWNRHYSRKHIAQLMRNTGFNAPEIHSRNYAMQEVQLLTSMLRDNWIKQDRLAELQLFPELGRRGPGKRSLLTTTWDVTTYKRA